MRPILISLSPNTQIDDVLLALRTLFLPWKWNDKNEVEKLEEEFVTHFPSKIEYKALAVNSGRSAEYLILKALGIGKNDDVAIQAFTCVAVPNSIQWLGAKPVYVDIDKDYNMDAKDLEKKITKNTRAIIVQHTFGIPANLKAIAKVATKRKVTLIEDCAHSLGGSYFLKLLGLHGDVSFFSFGRDKQISSVFGGMILCSNEELYKKLKDLRDKLPESRTSWTLQQLFHPLAFSIIKPTYFLGIGKIMLYVLQKLNTLSKAVDDLEKIGKQPGEFPTKMPGGLAILARHQLKKLGIFANRRFWIGEMYKEKLKEIVTVQKEGAYLRFPISVNNPMELINFAKKRQIMLGDWYRSPVVPVKDLGTSGYKEGSCPNAEIASQNVVNLPTYPIMTDVDVNRVIEVVKQWLNTQPN